MKTYVEKVANVSTTESRSSSLAVPVGESRELQEIVYICLSLQMFLPIFLG